MSELNEAERLRQRLEAEGYRYVSKQDGDIWTTFTFFVTDRAPAHTLLVHTVYTDATHRHVQHCEVYTPR